MDPILPGITDLLQQMQMLSGGNLELDDTDDTPIAEDTHEYRPGKPVPYYPAERYVQKGLKPEMTLHTDSMAAIAKAQRLAEDTGVLSPEVAKYMLPIAMVEGWGAGMGVRDDPGNALYASQRVKKSLADMGLKEGESITRLQLKNEPHFVFSGDPQDSPKMAAVYLAEKAALLGKGQPVENVIKRYNGIGSAIEDVYGTLVPASVKTYWKKIEEARSMLDHPVNKAFKEHYQKEYGR